MRKPGRAIALALAFASVLVVARPAAANPGLRFGLTDGPDTIFLGFFYEALLGGRRGALALEPGVDLGFDDDFDFFTIRGSLNGKYLVPIGRRALIYPLVGLSIYYFNFDCPGNNSCDDTTAGMNLGGGLRFGRLNLELMLGIPDDIPDITFQVGFLL